MKQQQVRIEPRDRIRRAVFVTGLFLLGSIIGRLCWNHIKLPFSNPWNIRGPLTELKINPNDSYLRCIIFILIPSVLLWLAYWFSLRLGRGGWIAGERNSSHEATGLADTLKSEPSQRKTSPAVLLLALMVLGSALASLYVPTDIATDGFDSYHEGESLGPAALCMQGQVPYRDYVVSHGAFQDPLRSVLAFKLFGRSIASTRVVASGIKVVQFALMACVIALLFMPNTRSMLSALIIFLSLNFIPLDDQHAVRPHTLTFATQRDVTLYLFLPAMILLYRLVRKNAASWWKVSAAAFAAGFTAFAALIYSVDRGTYLSMAYVLLLPVLYVTYVRGRANRLHFLLSSVGGVSFAVLLLGSVIGWDLVSFVHWTFLYFPRYSDLVSGLVYPIDNPLCWGMVVLLAASGYWITLRFIRLFHRDRMLLHAARSFIDGYFEEALLLLLAILFFKSATGRSDWAHLAINSNLPYLLALVVCFKRYASRLSSSWFAGAYAIVLVGVVVVGFAWGVASLSSGEVLKANFPIGVRDSEYVPETYTKTGEFIEGNLRADETFYTLTSEGVWYYLIKRRSPTRFPVVSAAIPDFTHRQITRELSKNNCKIILVTNSYWACAIDGFPASVRYPILIKFIAENYVPYKQIGDNALWIRKDAAH